MSSHNILILGGGVYQVPLIKRVQARGMRAVVASIPGNYPGIALADEFLDINTTDESGVVDAAQRINAAAVVTTGTDVALSSLGATVDALGLAGPTYTMAERATNKLNMKRAFAEGRVRTANFHEARTTEEAIAVWERLHPEGDNHPLMVKCPDRSGSRGISIAKSREDIPTAFATAVEASICGYAVIEDFIEGHEVGLDGYVNANGKISFIAYHDKVVCNNGCADVPVGHKMNDVFTSWAQTNTDLAAQAQLTATAVGMRNCFLNMDVLVDAKGKAWVIEAGVRVGATCIPEVISAYFGFDLYDAMIDTALGEEPVFPTKPVCGASEGRLLLSTKPGNANAIDVSSLIADIASKADVALAASVDYAAGEALPAFENGTSRLGQVVASGADPATISDAIDEASAAIMDAYFSA